MNQEIEIPEGVEAEMKGNELVVKGPEGENSREFNLGKINLEKKEKKLIFSCDRMTKKEKKIINTSTAHIKNMILGVKKKFEYKLKICSSHFPMTVKFEENKAIIKNFLGEKVDRKVELPKKVEVKLDKDIITVTSVNKEVAGQTAANLEKITKVRNKDRRIFQDGIYIINKSGKLI